MYEPELLDDPLLVAEGLVVDLDEPTAEPRLEPERVPTVDLDVDLDEPTAPTADPPRVARAVPTRLPFVTPMVERDVPPRETFPLVRVLDVPLIRVPSPERVPFTVRAARPVKILPLPSRTTDDELLARELVPTREL